MANNETARLAVLIDADNASASVVKELLEEVAKYGTATVKRAYGDWTTTNLVGWKEHLHRHAIQPMQQFAYTKGKNSTDSAFIIDAMDLLYAGNLDGFCLVSSDSDFTRLATRMREAGKVVYGFGERKTPEPFIAACDKFIFLEVLKRPAEAAAPMAVSDVPDLKGLLTHAITETSRDSGWASLSAVGSFINKNNTSFDPRNYGFTKLSELVCERGLSWRDASPETCGKLQLRWPRCCSDSDLLCADIGGCDCFRGGQSVPRPARFDPQLKSERPDPLPRSGHSAYPSPMPSRLDWPSTFSRRCPGQRWRAPISRQSDPAPGWRTRRRNRSETTRCCARGRRESTARALRRCRRAGHPR